MPNVTLIPDYSHFEEEPLYGGLIVAEFSEFHNVWNWNYYESYDWNLQNGGSVKAGAVYSYSWRVFGTYDQLRRNGKKVSFVYSCKEEPTVAKLAYTLMFADETDAMIFAGEKRSR